MDIDEKRRVFSSRFTGQLFERENVEMIGNKAIESAIEEIKDKSERKAHKSILETRLQMGLDGIEALAESPIEKQVGYALYACLFSESPYLCVVPPLHLINNYLADKDRIPGVSYESQREAVEAYWFDVDYWLQPNYWVSDKIRVDFLVTDAPRKYLKAWQSGKKNPPKTKDFVIECDSFEWHGDKAAFAKDKKRERELLNLGYPVLRFSGREINENPTKVAIEVIDYAFKHFKQK